MRYRDLNYKVGKITNLTVKPNIHIPTALQISSNLEKKKKLISFKVLEQQVKTTEKNNLLFEKEERNKMHNKKSQREQKKSVLARTRRLRIKILPVDVLH